MANKPDTLQRPTAMYLSISYDRLREQKGVGRQWEDGLEDIARRGWPLPRSEADIFVDNDVSRSVFSKKARKRYLELLAAIEADEYGQVWMAVEDRTHRQVLELAEFIKLCREHDVKVATVGTEYNLDDPDQVSMWFIKVRFAEAEVEKLSMRLKRERLDTARKGLPHIGGRRAFGDRGRKRVKVGDEWKSVPILTETEVARERELIREAARRVIAGDSLRGICSDWNARKILSPSGGPWFNQVLRRVLLAPRIAGKREHHGTIYDGDPTKLRPILDEQTWKAVKAILEDPSRRTQVGGGQPRHLLTGLLFCGVCGNLLRARIKPNGKGGEPYRTYYCQQPNKRAPHHVFRNADKVDELITEALFRAIETDEFAEEAGSLRPEDPTKPHVDRMAEITALLGRLEDKVAREVISEPAYLRNKAQLEQEWECEHAQYQRKKDGRVRAYLPKNIRALWDDYSLDRQRAIIASVTEWIRIHPLPYARVTDEQFVAAIEWQKKAWQ